MQVFSSKTGFTILLLALALLLAGVIYSHHSRRQLQQERNELRLRYDSLHMAQLQLRKNLQQTMAQLDSLQHRRKPTKQDR